MGVSDEEEAMNYDEMCPRCGYSTEFFDRLSFQPNYIPLERLMSIKRCPRCFHMWTLIPAEWFGLLKERGLLELRA